MYVVWKYFYYFKVRLKGLTDDYDGTAEFTCIAFKAPEDHFVIHQM